MVDDRVAHKTLLQLVIEAMVRGAASGAPSMVALLNEIRTKIRPMAEKRQGGLLVVPEGLSAEEWKAQAEKHNAVAQNPETYVDHMSEEFYKALRGIPTPLGEAILASHRRWSSAS